MAARSVLLACAAGLVAAAACHAAETDAGFALSYTAGQRDGKGLFMGGTEMRNLAAHDGKLYAGNGYWEDRPGAEGLQAAQILVLDGPAAAWRVEHALDGRLANGRPRHLAVSALKSVHLGTDAGGRALDRPVSMLLAGTWDLSGGSTVFVRDDATGRWTASELGIPRVASGIQQIRAIGSHRDRQTGVDSVFLGNDPHGIYRGSYDAARGGIGWDETPELDLASIAAPSFRGLTLLRVTSFAECNGSLFATIGQQIYRRVDGSKPRWELLYTNSKPGYSETGLRGLTAIANPSGAGQVLLVAVEGYAARMLRIDPASGRESVELDMQAYLDRAWRTQVSYVIPAYNDMTAVDEAVLIGIEAFLPAKAPLPEGHVRAGGLDGAGWYFLRYPDGRYDLHRIGAAHPTTGTPLVATRAIAASPFAADPDRVYFAGFDANKQPTHDTAWIFSASRGRALTLP